MSLAVRMPLLPLLDRARTALGAHTGWLVIIGVRAGNIRRLAVRHVDCPKVQAACPCQGGSFLRDSKCEYATITHGARKD